MPFESTPDKDGNVWIYNIKIPDTGLDTYEFKIPSFIYGIIDIREIARVMEYGNRLYIIKGPRAEEFPEFLKMIENSTEDELRSISHLKDTRGFIKNIIINGNHVKLHGDLAEAFMSLQADTIKFKDFDASEIRNVRSMFEYSIVKSIDLSGITFGKIDRADEMFAGCRNLKEIDISGMQFSSDINAELMFWQCIEIEKIVLPEIKLGHNANLSRFCSSCWNLKQINSENIEVMGQNRNNVVKVNLDNMFQNTSSIETLDLRGIPYEKLRALGNFNSSVLGELNSLKRLVLRYPMDEVNIKQLKGLGKTIIEGNTEYTILRNEASIKEFLYPIIDRPYRNKRGIEGILEIKFVKI